MHNDIDRSKSCSVSSVGESGEFGEVPDESSESVGELLGTSILPVSERSISVMWKRQGSVDWTTKLYDCRSNLNKLVRDVVLCLTRLLSPFRVSSMKFP